MQSNPASKSQKKMILIVALVLVTFALVFIFIAGTFFFKMMMSAKYIPIRTANAQPEIISIRPMTWTVEGTSISTGKVGPQSKTADRQVSGYRVTYKFTAADGQSITHTNDEQISNNPSDMAQVCYDPKNPNDCKLARAGKCD